MGWRQKVSKKQYLDPRGARCSPKTTPHGPKTLVLASGLPSKAPLACATPQHAKSKGPCLSTFSTVPLPGLVNCQEQDSVSRGP